MAHYAKIGLNSKVIAVTPVDDDIITNADGIEDDELAIRHLISTTGWPFWIKCSYNTINGVHYTRDENGVPVVSDTQEKAIRRFYPGIGDYYDEDADAFYVKKPHDSWIFNEKTGGWEPPVASPSTGHIVVDGENRPYHIVWNEENTRWQAADTIDGIEDKYWDPDTSTWINM